MIGGITYMGWFHTIVGIPAILVDFIFYSEIDLFI